MENCGADRAFHTPPPQPPSLLRITPPRRNTLSEMKKYARPQFIPTPIPADRRHDGRCRQESRRPMQQTALRPDPARCRPMATKRRCAGSEGVSLRITVTFVPPLQKNETEPNPAGFGSASSGRRRITSSVPSSRSAPSSQACGRGRRHRVSSDARARPA